MMNDGFTYRDMFDIKRIIIKQVSGGLLLQCGHVCYFGNPEDFTIGNLFNCTECSFEAIKFKVMEKSVINVSDNLRVSGHCLKDDKWSNN